MLVSFVSRIRFTATLYFSEISAINTFNFSSVSFERLWSFWIISRIFFPFEFRLFIRSFSKFVTSPLGRSIQQTGIDPDILVEQAELKKIDQISNRQESDLRGSIKNEHNSGILK